MRAAVVDKPFSVGVVEVPEPRPAPGHVVVAVGAASICGSDVNGFKGINPRNRLPTIPGHEVAGTVVSAGDDESRRWVGRRVVVEPNVSCRACEWCLLDLPNVCDSYRVLGESMDIPGGLAEFVRVAADQVYELPEHVDLAEGAMIQPMSIAYHGVVDRAEPLPGETVLVLGAGPIGLAAMLFARHLGARVVITDLLQERLEVARRLGADEVIRADVVDVGEAVKAITDGRGAAVTVEAVGGSQDHTIRDAVAATSTRGRIVVLGTFGRDPQSVPAYAFKNREQTLMGSHGHPRSFPPTIELIARQKIRPLELVTHRLPLDDVERAFNLLDTQSGGVVKVVIEP